MTNEYIPFKSFRWCQLLALFTCVIWTVCLCKLVSILSRDFSCSSCRMLRLWCSSFWRHRLISMTWRTMIHRSESTSCAYHRAGVQKLPFSYCVSEPLSCAYRSPTWSRPGRACVRSWGRSFSSTCLWWWAHWWRLPPSNLKWPFLIVSDLSTQGNTLPVHEKYCTFYSDFNVFVVKIKILV